MFLSPLDQFLVSPEFFIVGPLSTIIFAFSDMSLMMLFVAFFISFIFLGVLRSLTYLPNSWQMSVEMVFSFVYNLFKQNLGMSSQKFFPFFLFVFLFVLTSNLFGMIPYTHAITGHIAITFFIGGLVFGSLYSLSFLVHKMQWYLMFKPPGTPIFLLPFLFIIEVISHFASLFSLSIRLFANIMAGHTLLAILSGFCWHVLLMGGFFFVLHFLPLFLIFLIVCLELGIAFVQSYVLLILMILYANNALYLH